MSIDYSQIKLVKKDEFRWEIPVFGPMLVPGVIYGDEDLINELEKDLKGGKEWNALVQIVNVACLPGIEKASLAMADVHPGYGFCIGGVGAFNMDDGVVSVAGVGFDINCGVRCLKVNLKKDDVVKHQQKLADMLYKNIPAGLGSKGKLKLSTKEIDDLLVAGARFAIDRGYGLEGDLEYIEENGSIAGADPATVSPTAKQRQFSEMGTLGSGNHYLEVQYVDKVFDDKAASVFGFETGDVVVSVHCGSRALGHQIGTDYLSVLERASKKYDIPIRERELVCAPIGSPEATRYIKAVNCGINCAFANRQMLAHLTRKTFCSTFNLKPAEVSTFYEIGHNTLKTEEHAVDGERKKLIVHRKGSTRAFGPGSKRVPERYRCVGQPVLVGGTMGTSSFILHGTEEGMRQTWGSAIHGAGRMLSRQQAKKRWRATEIIEELNKKGIIVRGHGYKGIAEEAPGAYKDVVQVVDVMHNAGIARKVVQMKPLIVIKG